MNIRVLMLTALLLFCAVLGVQAQLSAGDVIEFGRYEQDNDLSNGPEPVEWQVLAAEDGRALLISRFGLDVGPYHSEFEPVTWAECDLRQWLNGPFLYSAFTEEEAVRISEVVNANPDNPEIGTPGGADTADRVFLLSIDEVKRYWPSVEQRTCEATEFVRQNGAYVDLKFGTSFWWLRSPGWSSESASIVFSHGLIYAYGSNVTSTARMVRPSLWISN